MNILPVKYHLLKPPFLLHGSAATDFLYKIESLDLNKNEVDELNLLNTDFKIKIIKSRNGVLNFSGCNSKVFYNNLMMLDSKMPHLLSEVLLISHSTNSNTVRDLISQLEKNNPLFYNFSKETKIYNYKISEFLKGIVLGLDSTTVWYGEPNLYEHLPVIKISNELIYYSDSPKKFIEILITLAKIEIISSNITHKNINENYLNLRLQINLKT